MKRLALAALLALTACAPTRTSGVQPPASPAPLQAAFSDAGVLWSVNGRAFIARTPAFQPQAVGLPAPAGAVAWQGAGLAAVPWVALPAYGLIVTASGAPQTQQVGRVSAMSARAVYRADGSAVSYGGTSTTGLPGAPGAVITGGDGEDYGVVAGDLYRVGTILPLDRATGPVLFATPSGAATANVPTLVTAQGTYRLVGGELVFTDPVGVVRARVKQAGDALGLVAGRVAVLEAGGRLGFYNPDLSR